jgi:glycosyltransferase involved in cell wall biosynthesis
VIHLLDSVHARAGRSGLGRWLVRRLRVGGFSRLWLRTAVLKGERERPDDVTVLIGVRNRADHRLPLTLRSLREQRWPAERLHILVVDYGSEPGAARIIAEICGEYGAEYVRVDGVGTWSRARCLNVGVRRARTKFLMTSDVDILLSPDYVSQAVEILRRAPLSIVCSQMLDLPECTHEALLQAVRCPAPLPLHEWRERCEPRYGRDSHPSITVGYTAFYQLIRGYDEFYELWGGEDDDLFRRLRKLGLARRSPDSDAAYYLHQWHPKYENIPEEEREPAIRRNTDRLEGSHTLLRNGPDWGRGSPGA